MYQEITVASDSPMPKGYRFLHKGNRYKTLHGRKLTRESGNLLYVVVEDKKNIGLRVPISVYKQVQTQATETLPARRAATEKRDATDIAKVATEIALQFPKMPETEKDLVLKHGFRKHSGRVGRTSTISLDKKVVLAVTAHVRHKHTSYDALLKDGKDQKTARELTRKAIESKMCEWGLERSTTSAIIIDLVTFTDQTEGPPRDSQRRRQKKVARKKAARKALKTAR